MFLYRGIATNSGLGESCSSRDLLHRVNNIEHNKKRYVHAGMEVISLIPHDTVYKNRKNENVLINSINKLRIKYTLSIIL